MVTGMAMEQGDKQSKKKRPLELDWKSLLPSRDHHDLPQLIAEPASSFKTELPKLSSLAIFQCLSDRELEEAILRHEKVIEIYGSKLPDKGAKIQLKLDQYKDERERRTRVDKGDDCDKATQSTTTNITGACDGLKQENAPYTDSQSCFASHFCAKLEHKKISKTFSSCGDELSYMNCCEHPKKRSNEEFVSRGGHKGQYLPTQELFQCRTCSDEGILSPYSVHMKNDQVPPSYNLRSKKDQTVVLVDEEDPQLLETAHTEKLAKCMTETKIYYPSRNDPESVEICFADTECLDPQGYLTSTIMNFYIRYLQTQASSTNRVMCDCHFFSTYFYKKLKEAISYKGSDKYNLFVKFRRWWKGVNIFQKAYVLVPIHEDLHWSLVIICFPGKDDESRPIVLHLDSLGYHCSKSIFANIRSYLREEWNYLNTEVDPSEHPTENRAWKHLPRRLVEKRILVPQQKNDYDCGLFVLLFMERFIKEAPDRLKRKDLAMFGDQWFKPKEASGLRVKIRNLLAEEFRNASDTSCISVSSPILAG